MNLKWYDVSIWFISCNKYTTLVRDVNIGGGYVNWTTLVRDVNIEGGYVNRYGGTSCTENFRPSLQFCCEPKITLKYCVFLKYRKAFLLRFSCFLLDEAFPGCCKPSGSFQSSKKVDSDSFFASLFTAFGEGQTSGVTSSAIVTDECWYRLNCKMQKNFQIFRR